MNPVSGDLHDPCIATYQCLEAGQLNEALKEAGIGDAAKRRDIVEAFLSRAGYFRDSCWFEQAGRLFRPVMCFEEIEVNGQSKGALLVPDPSLGTLFHEYALGAAAWLFEGQEEDASGIASGSVYDLRGGSE
jgi:hypothetical protein